MIKKAFIVPDVHGRPFWRDAKEAITDESYDKVVFLGDYFDQYDDEEFLIDDDNLVNSYNEIIVLKKANPDRVILLLGNHDLHYLYKNPNCSRHDDDNEDRNCELIKSNLDLFDLMYLDDIDCGDYKRVLFTHAGLTSNFLKTFGRAGYPKDDLAELCKKVNSDIKAIKTHDYHVLSDLMMRVSRFRGGPYADGSIVWADLREVIPNAFDFDDVYQIFGHTRAFFPTIIKRYAMIDTRECYDADFSDMVIRNNYTHKEFSIT